MADQPLAFHSDNIHSTKAHEKREVFVKVEEKKTFKQTAEEFQKKFAAAKAHAAESRAKIENPGADANGVIRSHTRRPFPWKLVVFVVILIALGAGGYFAYKSYWPTIYSKYFDYSIENAYKLLKTDYARSIKIIEHNISKETDNEVKANLMLTKADMLDSGCGAECSTQILDSVYLAEETSPNYMTAGYIIDYETKYGSEEEAKKWEAIILTREEKPYGNG